MDIPGISANDPISSTTAANSGIGSQNVNSGEFLDLFVSQLRNQDPLDPIKNEDYVAQLAQFSSLEQLQTMNDNMIASIALNQSNALLSQLTQSSALIGKTVSWTDQDTGVESVGTVDAVKIDRGLAVLRIDGQNVPLATVNEILAAAVVDGTTDAGDTGATENTDSTSSN